MSRWIRQILTQKILGIINEKTNMDQYLIDLKLSILYFDLYELIELIEDSKNENLLCYVDELKKEFDSHTA